jgi:ribosome biogenesis GTPase A
MLCPTMEEAASKGSTTVQKKSTFALTEMQKKDLEDLKLDLQSYFEGDIKMVVIGNTNVGKSTYLNNLLGQKKFLNISEVRETACIWVLKSNTRNQFELTPKFLDVNKGEIYDEPTEIFDNLD